MTLTNSDILTQPSKDKVLDMPQFGDDDHRSHSTPNDYQMDDAPFPAPPIEQRSVSRGQNQDTGDISQRQRLDDPLSVLALAGRMVDRPSWQPTRSEA